MIRPIIALACDLTPGRCRVASLDVGSRRKLGPAPGTSPDYVDFGRFRRGPRHTRLCQNPVAERVLVVETRQPFVGETGGTDGPTSSGLNHKLSSHPGHFVE